MSYQFQTITYKNFGRGIDAKSTPNSLAEGFSERLTNVDISNNSIVKRRGYEGYAGWLPLRVKEAQHTADGKLKLFFDAAVSFVDTGVTPVVIYGRISKDTTVTGTPVEFVSASDSGHYYPTFTSAVPYVFVAPSGSGDGFNPYASTSVMLSTQRNTSGGSADSSWFLADSYEINNVSYEATISWSGLASNIDVFVSNRLVSGAAGREQVELFTASTGTTVLDISGLDAYTTVAQFYYLDGADWIQFIPDAVSVNQITGMMSVDTAFATSTSCKALIVVADLTSTSTISAGGGTITAAIPYTFFTFSCYANNNMLYPDALDYDADTDVATFTFSSLPANTTVTINVVETAAQTNFFTVDTPGDTSVYTDTDPQLTVWGFDPSHLYSSSYPHGADVMHIDSYRREGEERLMAGINGVLMKAVTYDEATAAQKYGSTVVSNDARAASDAFIGPAFAETSSTATRSNGLVRADNINTAGAALATAVSYVSSGVAVYQLSFTNKSGTMAAALSTSYDYLTVTGFANSLHNGTFKITAIDDSLNTITVANSRVTSARYDESGAKARAAVYTDRFAVLTASNFLDGDELALSSDLSLTCAGVNGTTVLLRNVTNYYEIVNTNKVYASRRTSVLPVASASNFVRGDMVSVTGLENKPRVVHINPDATQSCTITSNGSIATITTPVTQDFKAGMKIILISTANPDINGEYTIIEEVTAYTFTVAATWTVASLAASIVGPTLELDEVITAYDQADPMALEVAERWLPLDIPTTSNDLPASTAYQHLTSGGFTSQPTVRSAIIANNIYYTNGDDVVLKYDGSKVYRAGLVYWAPQLFTTVDTSTASIPLNAVSASILGRSGTQFTVAAGAQASFSVGDQIKHTADGAIYTITATGSSGTDGTVTVSATISGSSSGDIQLLNRYRYYVRLNAIDANNNVTASAVTGLDDYVIDMSAAGQIKHKLIGMPAFDLFDYDSLDIEVYRTLQGSTGPYYRVGVVDINFNNAQGYLEFTDATADDFLGTAQLDKVNTALLGTEVGTTWSAPLRAKYVTTMNNKLILMNVKGYPQLTLTLSADAGAGSLATSALSGKVVSIRKDSLDTSSTPDMTERAFFEFLTAGSGSVSNITAGASDFTVTTGAAHGLVAKDWVYLYHSATGNNKDLTFAGWFQVATAPTITTFTVNSGTLTTSASDVDSWVKASTSGHVPVFLGTDGNYAQIGMNVLNELTSVQRLANAINAVMRVTDKTLTGQTTFSPWITAAAGTTQGAGTIVLRQELVLPTTFEVTLPSTITGATWYADGLKVAAASQVQASTPIFPSRTIVSYENYPEIFDGPDLSNSPATSVIDVNAADGEELTGGLPFFGSSAFSAAQQEQLLINFKLNSIYAINLASGVASKLRSRGLGCTAPYSIAPTRDGIMFANNSGVYKLDSGLNVVYTGLMIETIYQDEVNRDALAVATGTHFATQSMYKLSVPVVGETKNSHVLVYNHQNEDVHGIGAWTEYTNHPATGWANLGTDAFFATSTGSVYKLRNTDTSSDYRDDANAVAEMSITLRAEDFGVSGIRKTVAYVTTHFQLRYSDTIDTTISMAYDLQTPFEAAGSFDFIKSADSKIKFARASVPRRKANYIQVKYTNSTKDESVILAGVDYTVSGLSHLGVKQIGAQ